MKYEVQTYSCFGQWENIWTEEDQPMTFETFQDAENELKEYLGELAHAVQFGMADFNPEDYRIMEVTS